MAHVHVDMGLLYQAGVQAPLPPMDLHGHIDAYLLLPVDRLVLHHSPRITRLTIGLPQLICLLTTLAVQLQL
jgi:hypothetical protein